MLRIGMRGLVAVLLAAPVLLAAAAAGAEIPDTTAAEAPCEVCRLWSRYEETFRYVTVEAGSLTHGVVYYLSSPQFDIVESLQRFAYERRRLEAEPEAAVHADQRRRDLGTSGTMRLEITIGVHGVFVLIESDDPDTAADLREEASVALRTHRAPRF